MPEPRLRSLIVVAALVAAPAAAWQWRCSGEGCEPEPPPARVPFCGLPAGVREQVEAGYRAGRSPDVLAVTEPGSAVATGTTAWPASDQDAGARVPLVVLGDRVRPGRLPQGTTLDAVAPTLAAAAGLERPFPEVRSGEVLDVLEPGAPAPLVVIVAWKGVGDLEVDVDDLGGTGASTAEALTGSLPTDPAAITTTLGTGGVPAQHGITGTLVRSDAGNVVQAFTPGAPTPVIASLAEDLDEATGQRSLIGLVADATADRGLIGGHWYPGADRDTVIVGSDRPADEVLRLVRSGYGSDEIPDLIGVTLAGPVHELTSITADIVDAVGDRAVVAVAGTGRAEREATRGAVVAADLTAAVGAPRNLIEDLAAGGVFLDAGVASMTGTTTTQVADAMAEQTTPQGGRRFADAAPGFSVVLAGYC